MHKYSCATYIFICSAVLLIFTTECALTPKSCLQPKKISKRLFTEETKGLSISAKQLYGEAMSYDDELERHRQSNLIRQKTIFDFDNALNLEVVDQVKSLLIDNQHLRIQHPIGSALWGVWQKKAAYCGIDEEELSSISAKSVFFIAQELAIDGKNKNFLESYCLTLKTDDEIKKIVFPHLHDSPSFDTILSCYCKEIVIRSGVAIDLDALLN